MALAGCRSGSGGSTAPGDPYFPTTTAGLDSAQAFRILDLKDGDTLRLTAQVVAKRVGNRTLRMLAYNGSVPGPFLRIAQGATLTVIFTNLLAIPTTLHAHGLRLDNADDGTPDLTQQPIPPGGTFTYTLKFPDAGAYWYHPHVREDYAQASGLFGGIEVEPGDSAYWGPANRELPLMLDDILLQGDTLPPFRRDRVEHALMGRYGNLELVNGDPDWTLSARRGEVIRFYVTDVANARPFKLAIPGALLKLVGSDGGRLRDEAFVTDVILGPGERAVVEAYFDTAGAYAVVNAGPAPAVALGTIHVSDTAALPDLRPAFAALRRDTAFAAYLDSLGPLLAKPPDKAVDLTMTMDMSGMGGMAMRAAAPESAAAAEHAPGSGIEWDESAAMRLMDDFSNSGNTAWKIVDMATGRSGMDIRWTFRRGDMPKIRIYNDSTPVHPMQHPIHFHGNRFLVAAEDGRPPDLAGWKDTYLVPVGHTVDILLDCSNPGRWMAHCHIAEHLGSGMMFEYDVIDDTVPVQKTAGP